MFALKEWQAVYGFGPAIRTLSSARLKGMADKIRSERPRHSTAVKERV
jgi:hypothetical protein